MDQGSVLHSFIDRAAAKEALRLFREIQERRNQLTKNDSTVRSIMEIAGSIAGVGVVHSPAPSAGEKIIYRCSPGKYDGDFETFTLTMRFISKDVATAHERAKAVSAVICAPGDRKFAVSGDYPEFITRDGGGGSGYIGRTGHYFVLVKFSVRRRLPSAVKIGIVNGERM